MFGHHDCYVYNYDIIWKRILKAAQKSPENVLLNGFVSYDDTPRRGEKGIIIQGSTPEKFYKYMKKLVKISISQKKEFVFLTAWNEWGEGAYLEPDNKTEYNYLEVIRTLCDEI